MRAKICHIQALRMPCKVHVGKNPNDVAALKIAANETKIKHKITGEITSPVTMFL